MKDSTDTGDDGIVRLVSLVSDIGTPLWLFLAERITEYRDSAMEQGIEYQPFRFMLSLIGSVKSESAEAAKRAVIVASALPEAASFSARELGSILDMHHASVTKTVRDRSGTVQGVREEILSSLGIPSESDISPEVAQLVLRLALKDSSTLTSTETSILELVRAKKVYG